MEPFLWPVVPLCDRQRLDVRDEDVLEGGLYRKCNTYRGGGGYDKYPAIAEARFGKRLAQQFVVQLYGCPLRCPYCYVTPDGVRGVSVPITASSLASSFKSSGQEVFHLMGGAPALYLSHWPELLDLLGHNTPFHSDFLLCEGVYTKQMIKRVCRDNCLYAINIKGVDHLSWQRNTGLDLPYPDRLILYNLLQIFTFGDPKNFYFTFTNLTATIAQAYLNWLYGAFLHGHHLDIVPFIQDYFCIDLIRYNAIGGVDEAIFNQDRGTVL